MKLSIPLQSLLLLSVALVSFPARGQVIFSNFSDDPLDPHYAYAGTVYGHAVQWQQTSPGFDHGAGYGLAMSFTNTTGVDQLLGTVSLAMYKVADGAPANLTIQLIRDNGSGVPSALAGDILETLAVDPAIMENADTFLNLTSALNPVLESGATFWITARPTRVDTDSTAQDVFYYWIQNNEGSLFKQTASPYLYYEGDWADYYHAAPSGGADAPTLHVTAFAAVPEFSAYATMAGLAACVVVLCRRRGTRAPAQS